MVLWANYLIVENATNVRRVIGFRKMNAVDSRHNHRCSESVVQLVFDPLPEPARRVQSCSAGANLIHSH